LRHYNTGGVAHAHASSAPLSLSPPTLSPPTPAIIGAGAAEVGELITSFDGMRVTVQDPHASPAVQLDPRQQLALDKVKAGHNVFVTGVGGTGKTVLLREIVKHLEVGLHSLPGFRLVTWMDPWLSSSLAGVLNAKSHGEKCQPYLEGERKVVAITAPTGLAAEAIGGCTIHSAAGIKVPSSIHHMGSFFGAGGELKKRRINTYHVLVIDEVSMVVGLHSLPGVSDWVHGRSGDTGAGGNLTAAYHTGCHQLNCILTAS
jgi:hypothetical protein